MLTGLAARKKQSVGSKKQSKPRSTATSGLEGTSIRTPHGFQWRGAEFLVTHGGAGLFANPGTGKTAIVERAFKALKDAGTANRALVIAPLRVCHNVWPYEAAEWRGSEWDCLNDLKLTVLHGSQKDKLLREDADIFVINPDGLQWLFSDAIAAANERYETALKNGARQPRWELRYKDAQKFLALGIDTLIVDESTKFKNHGTKRFKMMKVFLSTFKRRWIMTGTPNPRSYMDLWGQIYIIDCGAALGRYITHYRTKFFSPVDEMGWEWFLNHDADKEIQKLIAPYIFYLDANDYVKMPKIVENIIRIDLPEKARKTYDEMEEQFLTYLDAETPVTAVSSGSKAMKCAQIANGGLYHEKSIEDWNLSKRTWTDIHEAKIDAVEDIIEELSGAPVMIVYDYKHDLARLLARFGKDTPYVGGGVSTKRSKEIEDAWNRSEIPILLVHPQAMGHGLNLQKGIAQNIIWHSMTYDLELYDQLNKRLARQGSQHDVVFVHQIIAVNTVDVAKARALKKKGESQKNFLKALKEYAIERGLYKPIKKSRMTKSLQPVNDEDIPF